jgi:hypothetical protein
MLNYFTLLVSQITLTQNLRCLIKISKNGFHPSSVSFIVEATSWKSSNIMVLLHLIRTIPALRLTIMLGSSSVQVMYQTVCEFFLQPDGCVANSKFRMSEKDAYTSISMTCIWYLMLCAARTTLASRPSNIKSWTLEHFEGYV